MIQFIDFLYNVVVALLMLLVISIRAWHQIDGGKRIFTNDVLRQLAEHNSPRKPGVPSREEMYKILKARSIELQKGEYETT
jgi:hypothetical protein